MRGHPEHYVSPWYSIEMYKQTYSMNYRPVLDEEQWPRFDLPKIDPPSFKRGVGRPPMKRRRTEEEGASRKRSRVVRCGRCKAFGHNVKTCKGGATTRELKEQGIRSSSTESKEERNTSTISGERDVLCPNDSWKYEQSTFVLNDDRFIIASGLWNKLNTTSHATICLQDFDHEKA
ncbi:hypothetical protein V2J09_011759 [Rumex salicifolius]